ncbi:hypothetical protein BDZ89DRAFT_1072808 [Hymenopellis radicata]|nr:hypothetical protein BDZ89DRAFT_1072808 [Hymenopellis radicata]
MADAPSFASMVPKTIPTVSADASFEDIASRPFHEDTLPTMVSKVKATTTRAPTKTEIRYSYDRQLHLVCHHPGFWDALLGKLDRLPAWKAISEQDLGDPDMKAWAYSLDPNITYRSLDMVMHSEEDAADHSVARVLRPATKIVQAMSEWMHREEDDPGPTITLSATFATQDQSLPDRVLPIIEFKTANSLNPSDFKTILKCFKDLMGVFGDPFPVPYYWMDEGEGLQRKVDKIFCQLWCELQSYQVKYGLLSSFLSNMIVYRADVMGKNCLYFSDFVNASDLTLKHIVALEAVALGWITPPLPPKLSDEVRNFMTTYSDTWKLNELLRTPAPTAPGWMLGMFRSTLNVKLAKDCAPGNLDTGSEITPKARRPPSITIGMDDGKDTPRQRGLPAARKAKSKKVDRKGKNKEAT